ncbi:MAG: glycosyltransferase family 2 protein [Thermoanaerobaculales bacterium]|nr:glycosyltransferase family 2 protein [Thermoanaerobaculales bacterium]
MSDRGSIAVVIPAFNAAPSIGDVVQRTLAQMPEVLVIDDGSNDQTAEEARSAGAEVLIQPENRGKGAALRLAFTTLFERGFAGVLTLDADGQHLPEEIPKLMKAWPGGADLILGSREHLFAEMARIRRASNGLSSRAISFAAGRVVADVQTGFRLYSRSLLEATGFPEDRFEAESAVVVRAARRGFTIETVPIRLGFADGRCTSHYRPLVDSLRIARAVIRARFEGHGRPGL